MTQKKNNKKLHHGSRLTLWLLLSFAIIVVLGLVLIGPYIMSKSKNDAVIYIPKDATMEQVKDTLTKYYPEDYSRRVVHMLKIYGFNPAGRHGRYKIGNGASPFTTAHKLSRGGQDQVEIRFNGFRSLDYLAEKLAQRTEFS